MSPSTTNPVEPDWGVASCLSACVAGMVDLNEAHAGGRASR